MKNTSAQILVKKAWYWLFLSCLHHAAAIPTPKLRECRIGSDVHAIGSTFHPVVRADGDFYTAVCTICTCTGVFIPACEKLLCPVTTCTNPVRREGECCARCEDKREESSGRPSQCIFNGFLIEHEHSFHPALLDPSQSDNSSNPYCRSCTCLDGNLKCKSHFSECPTLNCQGTSVVPEKSCCPVCPSLPMETTTAPAPRKPNCRDIDGRTFFNGDQWHPAYPSLGLITCINCTCVDSRSVCVKLPCPEGPLPPCSPDEPVDNVVLCCPKCAPVSYASTSTEPIQSEAATVLPVNTTIAPVIITTCLKGHTIKVWQHRESSELAMEDINNTTDGDNMVITIWKLQSVNGTYQHTTTVERVHASYIVANFDFIGWTKPARVHRLTSDSKKQQKIDKCRSNCYSVLLHLLRVRNDCDGRR